MVALTRDGTNWTPQYLTAIDEKVCIGCGRCYKVCGRNVMTLKAVNDEGELINLEDDEDEEFEKKVMAMNLAGLCVGCGACARVCPTNCQTHTAADVLAA
jgi:Nif-specific ferredoxin III